MLFLMPAAPGGNGHQRQHIHYFRRICGFCTIQTLEFINIQGLCYLQNSVGGQQNVINQMVNVQLHNEGDGLAFSGFKFELCLVHFKRERAE
jgi:hypothetical protein